MNNLAQYADWATIIGIPISLCGLVLAYLSLRKRHTKTFQSIGNLTKEIQQTNTKIESLNDIVNLHNKYSSTGDQYHNCTITNAPIEKKELKKQYAEG